MNSVALILCSSWILIAGASFGAETKTVTGEAKRLGSVWVLLPFKIDAATYPMYRLHDFPKRSAGGTAAPRYVRVTGVACSDVAPDCLSVTAYSAVRHDPLADLPQVKAFADSAAEAKTQRDNAMAMPKYSK